MNYDGSINLAKKILYKELIKMTGKLDLIGSLAGNYLDRHIPAGAIY